MFAAGGGSLSGAQPIAPLRTGRTALRPGTASPALARSTASTRQNAGGTG